GLRLLPRRHVHLGVPPLGEVPEPLLAAAADDGDLTASGEHLQHEPHLAAAPPAAVFTRASVRLDLAREQGAPLLELTEHVAAKGRFLLQVPDQAPVERAVG